MTEATIAGFVADTDAAIEKTLASSSLEPDAQNTLRPALQTHHRDRIKWGLNEMSRSREQ